MSGAAESPGSKQPNTADWGAVQGDVAALIRTVCGQGVRRGVRVVATDKRGHIFFDQGHVVHAEFGEDVGLGAVIEMLHSRPLEFRPCARPWPSQPTLFFTAEKLLAATRPGAANVITGVRLKPGLLSEEIAREAHERGTKLDPPASPAPGQPLTGAVSELSRAVAAAAAVHRTTSGSGPSSAAPASALAPAAAPAPAPPPASRSAGSERGGFSAQRPPARTLRGPFTLPPPSLDALTFSPRADQGRGSASERQPLTPARTLPVAPGTRGKGAPRAAGDTPASGTRAAVHPPKSAPAASDGPPKSSAAPKSSPASGDAAPSSAVSSSAISSSAVSSSVSGGADLAVASEPVRAVPGAESQSEPLAVPRPRLPVVWVQPVPSPGYQRQPASKAPPAPTASAPDAAPEQPSTTMVRVSSRGTLLAARGAMSEQLANAAAFIHNQARLIAQDLGRHGRTAVHVRGGDHSLLVVKSEVNDIAAALGPSERLRSLLRKAGLG